MKARANRKEKRREEKEKKKEEKKKRSVRKAKVWKLYGIYICWDYVGIISMKKVYGMVWN